MINVNKINKASLNAASVFSIAPLLEKDDDINQMDIDSLEYSMEMNTCGRRLNITGDQNEQFYA